MKTIRNKTRTPLRIALPGGKFLHLGPAKTGQISDHAVDQPAIKSLIKAKKIEVTDQAGQSWGEEHPAANEAKRGHPQATLVQPKGNR
jgi:hypothetical protein